MQFNHQHYAKVKIARTAPQLPEGATLHPSDTNPPSLVLQIEETELGFPALLPLDLITPEHTIVATARKLIAYYKGA